MADHIGDGVPERIHMGETVKFRVSHDDHASADGWTIKYKIAAQYQFNDLAPPDPEVWVINATATADGDSWLVTFAAAITAGLAPGTATWQAWAEKDNEKYILDSGNLEVVNELDRTAFGTQAERDLLAVRRALVPATSVGVQEYEINGVGSGRRLRNYSREDLLLLETRLAQRVNAEKRRAARAKGAPYFKTIFPR